MESQTFDRLTRSLATGTSRRTLLRRLAGGMLAAAGLSGAPTTLARPNKVGVCHSTGSATNPWEYIAISENAYRAHEAHGDGLFGSVDHCGTCGNACADAPANGYPVCLDDSTCGFGCDGGYHDGGDGLCHFTCDEGYHEGDDGACHIMCEEGYHEGDDGACHIMCEEGYHEGDDGLCHITCDECYHEGDDGLCHITCDEGYHEGEDGLCHINCDEGYHEGEDGLCHITCPDDQFEGDDGQCRCAEGYHVGDDGLCVKDPSIHVSFIKYDENTCWAKVDLTNFRPNISYSVVYHTSSTADGQNSSSTPLLTRTDGDGNASDTVWGDIISAGNYLSFSVGDVTTPWTLISC